MGCLYLIGPVRKFSRIFRFIENPSSNIATVFVLKGKHTFIRKCNKKPFLSINDQYNYA